MNHEAPAGRARRKHASKPGMRAELLVRQEDAVRLVAREDVPGADVFSWHDFPSNFFVVSDAPSAYMRRLSPATSPLCAFSETPRRAAPRRVGMGAEGAARGARAGRARGAGRGGPVLGCIRRHNTYKTYRSFAFDFIQQAFNHLVVRLTARLLARVEARLRAGADRERLQLIVVICWHNISSKIFGSAPPLLMISLITCRGGILACFFELQDLHKGERLTRT